MTRRNIFTHVSIDSAPLKLPVGSVMVCDLAGNSTIWGVSINHAKEAARMNPEAFRLSAALVGILLLVLLVARFKWHPFLALMFVSWGLGVTCGIAPVQAIAAFSKGFGDILSFVGIVIGLGTMIGGLLVSSGGADAFANAMISIGGRKYVPWTLFFCGLLDRLAVVFRSRVCSPGTIGVRDGQENGRADSKPRLTYACRSFHRAWDDSAAPCSNISCRYFPRCCRQNDPVCAGHRLSGRADLGARFCLSAREIL